MSAQIQNISIHNNTFYNNGEAIRWKSGTADNLGGTNYFRNNILWRNGTGNPAIKD